MNRTKKTRIGPNDRTHERKNTAIKRTNTKIWLFPSNAKFDEVRENRQYVKCSKFVWNTREKRRLRSFYHCVSSFTCSVTLSCVLSFFLSTYYCIFHTSPFILLSASSVSGLGLTYTHSLLPADIWFQHYHLFYQTEVYKKSSII